MSIQPFAPEERLTRRLVNQRLAAIDQALPPVGGILLWSGAADAIPTGWALCDGENGTPDLRDRFIVGAGGAYEVGATGGEATHTLTTAELPSHSHGVGSLKLSNAGAHTHTYDYPGKSTSSNWDDRNLSSTTSETKNTGSAGNHTHTISGSTAAVGSGTAHNNLPPYYALAFIMRIS